jgi:glycerol-3-phosphate dehydrogenase
MNRAEMLKLAKTREKPWDFVVIGGGATGAGCALDAAARGFSVLLLEQSDFGKGTSSRSTKLVHGGVRYLAHGNFSLVREALRERRILQKNAAHLVRVQPFVVPVYHSFDLFFYGSGLKFYNFLSGADGFGKSEILSKAETIARLPNVKAKNLRGGIVYFDAQFDDARLLINLMQTAAERGATVLNYARVFEFVKNARGKIVGVNYQDNESGEVFTAEARVVVNATGAFCDAVRKLSDRDAPKIIAPSQGVHLVFDRRFLPGANALMIPKTPDNRILFAIPWHGKTLVGTTDTAIENAELEPRALDAEIEFILDAARDHFAEAPTRADVLSVFAGIRPLVQTGGKRKTAALARDHTIEIDDADLLTIAGGKWTTYRTMARDAVDRALKIAGLPPTECATENLKIHGATADSERFGDLEFYGADAEAIEKIIAKNPDSGEKLHANLPYRRAEIVWAVKNEMARTIEDVLARRTRALFLDARAAIEIAPQVARVMAPELGKDADWVAEQVKKFNETARNFFPE